MYALSTDLVQRLAAFISGGKALPEDKAKLFAREKWVEDVYVAYLLDLTGPHTHYMVQEQTLAYPWDGSNGDPKWWSEAAMGVHPLKDGENYTRAFKHYRRNLQSSQACYTQHASASVQTQVAACSRQLPSWQVTVH
jgi:hypothetical protein